ncbi:MAG: peptidoglycan DD-metalloendopeptidase family protein [Candidatus Riflebacteria bacterium]|nr:peptidoglycan DD-metalloendopeptidase family protein [Candidatus Riflebacteria bacterium]
MPCRRDRLLLIIALTVAVLINLPAFAGKDTDGRVPREPGRAEAAKTRPKGNDNLQIEIDSINLQLDYLKVKLSDSLKKTRKLEARIKSKRDEITQLQAQVEQLNERQSEITLKIADIEKESLNAREQINLLLERFRARLVQLHKIKQGTLIGSVFSARDLNSFLNRYQMVKYLLNSDKELLQQLKTHDLRQRKLAVEMQARQQQLESGKVELAEKSKKLDTENSAFRAMLSTVLLEKKLFLEKEKTLATARKQLESEINRIEESRNAPDLESELAVAAPLQTEPAIASAHLPESAPEAAKIMKFMWPVIKAKRQSLDQTGDELTTALYISTIGETEVQSAARGKVAYRGSISGLGNVLIIGHSRGFSTVYARLDEIWVGLGQIVERGEVIGRIIGGRNLTLQFEIRFGGKKQQPLDYLSVE